MTTATITAPTAINISAGDRLGFTLFMALALHAILILGVGFTTSDDKLPESLPSLDIILANTQSPEQPDDPDFMAQSNQQGGGEQDEKARPSAPVSAPTPLNHQGLNDHVQPQKKANQLSQKNIYYINQREAQREIEQAQKTDKTLTPQDSLSDVELKMQNIASLQAEIRQMTQAYARRPREIALTASTREAVEAGYLAQWVSKIEHIGNLNYPAEAEIGQISGSLRMNVRINTHGQVIDINISSSSGKTILDEAAKRIVRLAQPFAPFPAKLRQKADQIVIVRTWKFESSNFSTNGN